MLADALLEKIALFYYLVFLDETKAMAATSRTMRSFRHGQKKRGSSENAAIVRELEKQFKKTKASTKPSSLSFTAGALVTTDEVEWGPWFEFRKTADDREFRTVVYSAILKFSDQVIADGMKVPVGTVRYRVGRGLRALGHVLQVGVGHA